MSHAASQAAAFYRDVARDRRVWMLDDGEGLLVMRHPDGYDVVPVWSSQSRAAKAQKRMSGGWQQASVTELSWESFRERFVEGFTRDGILIGVNWSGERVTGYDISAEDLVRNVETATEPGDQP